MIFRIGWPTSNLCIPSDVSTMLATTDSSNDNKVFCTRRPRSQYMMIVELAFAYSAHTY